jgi:hypothetical protein
MEINSVVVDITSISNLITVITLYNVHISHCAPLGMEDGSEGKSLEEHLRSLVRFPPEARQFYLLSFLLLVLLFEITTCCRK